MSYGESLEGRLFNLRKELARCIWMVRNGAIDVFEVTENTRDLVAMCPEDILEEANKLCHDVMKQITKKYGRYQIEKLGLKVEKFKISAIKPREYTIRIKLPKNFIG
jgi:hypothetical protein